MRFVSPVRFFVTRQAPRGSLCFQRHEIDERSFSARWKFSRLPAGFEVKDARLSRAYIGRTRSTRCRVPFFLSFFLYSLITLDRTAFIFKRRSSSFSVQESREKHPADINVVIFCNIVTITR